MDPPAAGRSRHVYSSGSLLLSEAHAEPLSSQHSSVALKPWLLPRRPVIMSLCHQAHGAPVPAPTPSLGSPLSVSPEKERLFIMDLLDSVTLL